MIKDEVNYLMAFYLSTGIFVYLTQFLHYHIWDAN